MTQKETKPYTFRVIGHGHDIPGVTVTAESEEKAFKEALTHCKHFDLPGWRLLCVDTGMSQPVSEFYRNPESRSSEKVRL